MKKKIIILIVLILLFVAGGVFWWWQTREIKGSPEDFMIRETPKGKIVENKRAGLKMRAPAGWEVERVEVEEGAIAFNSRDLETDRKEGEMLLPLKRGCRIQGSILYERTSFADIKIDLRYSFALMGMKSVSFEETTIHGYPALRSIFDKEEKGDGVGMSISIPVNNKVYGFSVLWGSDEKEQCLQEFNKFLETILIK
jgi:hypothetical protein